VDKTISLAILAGGIVLVVFGVNASNSVSSDISRIFTDAPTNKAIWMLAGGIILTIVGLAGLLRGARR
jgi:Protein of unknown function (DUF3185)